MIVETMGSAALQQSLELEAPIREMITVMERTNRQGVIFTVRFYKTLPKVCCNINIPPWPAWEHEESEADIR